MAPIGPEIEEVGNSINTTNEGNQISRVPTVSTHGGENYQGPPTGFALSSSRAGKRKSSQITVDPEAPLRASKRRSNWSQKRDLPRATPTYDELARRNASMLTTSPVAPRYDWTRRSDSRSLMLPTMRPAPSPSMVLSFSPPPPAPQLMLPPPLPSRISQPTLLERNLNTARPIKTLITHETEGGTLYFEGYDGLEYLDRENSLAKDLKKEEEKLDFFLRVGAAGGLVKILRELIEDLKDQLYLTRAERMGTL